MPSLSTLDRHLSARPATWGVAYTALLIVVGLVIFADSLALPVRLPVTLSGSDLATLAGHPHITRSLALALHILACLLLAIAGLRFGTGAFTAGLGGFLFLVNVAHFDVIYAVSSLDLPLALPALLAALLFLRPYLDSGSWHWLVPCAVCLLAAFILQPLSALLMPLGFYLWSETRTCGKAARPSPMPHHIARSPADDLPRLDSL